MKKFVILTAEKQCHHKKHNLILNYRKGMGKAIIYCYITFKNYEKQKSKRYYFLS